MSDRISLSVHYAKSLQPGLATMKKEDEAGSSNKGERLVQAVSTLFKSLEPPEMMINRWLAVL